MLSPKGVDVLGMASVQKAARRPSAVSQALRAMSTSMSRQKPWRLSTDKREAGYRIVVASSRALRKRAYALAWRVYSRAGYVQPGGPEICVSPHDASKGTLTLLAEDADGRDLATISLVFDSSAAGLPCDEIYRPEANNLRNNGCLLSEVTRLAIAESCSGARELLLHLFNHCYIFARIVRGYSDLLVEVNPRHVNYYQRLLRFEQAGPERPCSRVQGAPAVLLRLNISEIEAIVKETGCTSGRDLSGRRLHPYPYSPADEAAIAEYLAHNQRPMTEADVRYFDLEATFASSDHPIASAL